MDRPDAVKTISAKVSLVATRFKLRDLFTFVNLLGEAESAEWKCSEQKILIISRPKSRKGMNADARCSYRTESLRSLILAAPRGKITDLQACIRTKQGKVTLSIGGSGRFPISATLTFEGPDEDVPESFKELVGQFMVPRRIRSAFRILLSLAAFIPTVAYYLWILRLLYQLVPEAKDDSEVFSSIVSGIGFGLIPLLISLIAFEAISASSVRLRPMVRLNTRIRIREARTSFGQAIRRSWYGIRHGDHQFNAVLLAFTALLIAIFAWLFPLK